MCVRVRDVRALEVGLTDRRALDELTVGNGELDELSVGRTRLLDDGTGTLLDGSTGSR